MIPKKIKIGAKKYDVVRGDHMKDRGNTSPASVNFYDLKIWVSEKANDFNSECFMHEVVEAINYQYELGLPHNKITILGEVLYQIIKENKLEL